MRTSFQRTTGETSITGEIDLAGTGVADIDTGLGFLDHMLGSLAKHSGIDLTLAVASGDLQVDDHHVTEDCAIAVGRALDEALGDRAGISRFGHAYVAMDESLARAVVDLSGRGWSEIAVTFTREKVGDVATENLVHFLRSLASEARMTLHLDLLKGSNNHHVAEACFKALALALGIAVAPGRSGIPSTKGALR